MEARDEEPLLLRACIRDLVALSALPAMWVGKPVPEVIGSFLDVLLTSLRLVLVYARFKDPGGGHDIEEVRSEGQPGGLRQPGQVGLALTSSLGPGSVSGVPNPVGGGELRAMPLQVALGADVGTVIVGSRRPDFPTDLERSVLGVAVNLAATWLLAARVTAERVVAENDLRESRDVLEAVNRMSQAISAELDVQKLLQRVIDAATDLTGARVGAFAYNVVDEHGESDTVYARSGAPRERFASFLPPRNTGLFEATFRGEAIVRLDDVRQDPRYAADHSDRGAPAGHLPVTSYLAVPVVLRTGEVFGGLFFAHPDVAVFTERDERIVAGLGGQLAVAIDNARLYEAERRARMTAEAANRAKDAFLATVSHELRTPLSPILTWTRMLKMGALDDEKVGRALDTIDRCARTQAQLIEDLLDISRIVAGKLRLDVRPVSLGPIIDAAVEVVKPAADAKGVRLEAVLDTDVGEVSGDGERLQQVMWNLLSNAVKFTPRGGRVTVGLKRVDSHVEVAVADTGKGIGFDFLPHVFERFQQADTGPSRPHGGLGLGLAIVRHIVEAHGGTIHAASRGEECGSIFTVTLPLLALRSAGEADRRSTAGRSNVQDYASLAGLQVVLVDDEPDSSEAVRELLSSCGADVRVAASAEEARDVLRRRRADLLVSDVGMPGEDGYAFIANLRAQDGDVARMPAVALTAYASRDDKIRLLAAGFQAHVPKPVDPAELVTVLASIARGTGKL